jgi:hypothetical protein
VFDPAPPARVDFIALEALFENHPEPKSGFFRDFKGKIKEKYLTHTLYQWKTIIFGIGVVLIIIGLFL